ncbi:MAG TPA: AGE family epimerase/isomerase [Caulobacteraceae bacterium]
MKTTGPPAALRETSRVLSAWLTEKAFPLWWRAGADLNGGGYHDRLDRFGRPVDLPKRARVAARQAFCFANAPEFGWDGPWRRAMNHGLDFLRAAHLRPDGLYRARGAMGWGRSDDTAELYDQAFVILALANAERRGNTAVSGRASALLAKLRPNPLGGFHELEGGILRSNPNMHLLEAFMAWWSADPRSPGQELAKGQCLLVNRLIDPASGAIAEVYDRDWRPAADPAVREVSPGHQFEWASLLLRLRAMAADPGPPSTALRLIQLAEEKGMDRARGVAINALDGNLRPRDTGARLWPQTERLKATLMAGEITGESAWWSAADEAAGALGRFLEDSGLWKDQMDARGVFVEEPAPASSFYHIVGAILELRRATEAPR